MSGTGVAFAEASALVKLVIVEPEGPALLGRFGRHGRVLMSVLDAVGLVRVGRRAHGLDGERDAEDLVAGLAVESRGA